VVFLFVCSPPFFGMLSSGAVSLPFPRRKFHLDAHHVGCFENHLFSPNSFLSPSPGLFFFTPFSYPPGNGPTIGEFIITVTLDAPQGVFLTFVCSSTGPRFEGMIRGVVNPHLLDHFPLPPGFLSPMECFRRLFPVSLVTVPSRRRA